MIRTVCQLRTSRARRSCYLRWEVCGYRRSLRHLVRTLLLLNENFNLTCSRRNRCSHPIWSYLRLVQLPHSVLMDRLRLPDSQCRFPAAFGQDDRYLWPTSWPRVRKHLLCCWHPHVRSSAGRLGHYTGSCCSWSRRRMSEHDFDLRRVRSCTAEKERSMAGLRQHRLWHRHGPWRCIWRLVE